MGGRGGGRVIQFSVGFSCWGVQKGLQLVFFYGSSSLCDSLAGARGLLNIMNVNTKLCFAIKLWGGSHLLTNQVKPELPTAEFVNCSELLLFWTWGIVPII